MGSPFPGTALVSHRRRRTHSFLALVAMVALAGLLSGCSGSSAASEQGVASLTGGDAGSTPTPSPSSTDAEANALKFAQCMRDNGVKDFPDPEVDSDGNVRFGFRAGNGGGGSGTQPSAADRQALQKARQACSKYAQNLRGGFSQQDQTKLQDALLAYAKCMRANGYDMPDPSFDGSGGPGSGGPFGGRGINRDDPVWKKANAACESKLSQLRQFRPGGGTRSSGNATSSPNA